MLVNKPTFSTTLKNGCTLLSAFVNKRFICHLRLYSTYYHFIVARLASKLAVLFATPIACTFTPCSNRVTRRWDPEFNPRRPGSERDCGTSEACTVIQVRCCQSYNNYITCIINVIISAAILHACVHCTLFS